MLAMVPGSTVLAMALAVLALAMMLAGDVDGELPRIDSVELADDRRRFRPDIV